MLCLRKNEQPNLKQKQKTDIKSNETNTSEEGWIC